MIKRTFIALSLFVLASCARIDTLIMDLEIDEVAVQQNPFTPKELEEIRRLVEQSEESGLTVPDFMKEFLKEHLGPKDAAP